MIREYVLKRLKQCVDNNTFLISTDPLTRKENHDFIQEYNLTSKMQKEILKSLEVKDFSKAESNYKNKNQTVYIFGKDYELDHQVRGPEVVTCYIKFFFYQKSENERMLLISFHKAEWLINYPFK
ncbi:hypothetical protein [Intestinibacter sp.]